MRNKIFIIVSLLAAVFVFNSCLKDKTGVDWLTSVKGKMYAEVWNAGFGAFGVAPTPDTSTFKFLVNIATDQPPTQDITVTLAADTNAMNNYNKAKGTNYKLYPYIKIVDNPLVIKAGTRNAYVHVQVWHGDLLDACGSFMAPIVIESATGGVVPADPLNQGARLMAIPISNPYAADYHCQGYRDHPTAGISTVDQTETFYTIDCKTVEKVGVGSYPSFNARVEVTTNTMVVLGVTCFKVNVTVMDPSTGAPYDGGYGQYTTFTGSATTIPIPLSNDVNYYNPVTKMFVLNYYYNSSAPRILYDVLTRL
jgi:Domain of unknown function (DUF1735)/Domain of unknown function (DUF4361)